MLTCHYCGKQLAQKRFNGGVLESPSMLKRRKYCDRACMANAMRKEVCSSASHSRMKAATFAKNYCETCGATGKLHVHHIDGNPRNNDTKNLITLCPSCHRRCHSPNFTETGTRRVNCSHCNKPSVKKGLCFTHLSRLKRFGHPLAKKRRTACGWVLMLHDGENWLPFHLNADVKIEWGVCAPTATRSSRR